MTVFVFLGPTLSVAAARRELDAVYLPPVAQGDVYHAARHQPQAIGIIDGYFERVPAVWHKEILWAMSQGVHVFGSASIGALRAVELATFGMEGVGWIFDAYRTGVLEDDDEVAVVHGTAESGYRPLSVAMVNIRRTLAAATAQGVITPGTAAALERIAKDLFYPERGYPAILALGSRDGLPAPELAALRAWLPTGQVDQKRDDALAMLGVMRERLAAGLEPKQVLFHFEHTVFWDAVQQAGGDLRLSEAAPEALGLAPVLDELRLHPAAYRQAYQAVLIGALAHALAGQRGQIAPPDTVQQITARFQRDQQVRDPAALARWLADHDLSPARLAQLLEDEARLAMVKRWALPGLAARLPDHLRLHGAYAQLRERAYHKQQTLEAAGLANPGLDDAGLTREALLHWYFAQQLDQEIPPDLDQYAQEVGLAHAEALMRVLLREFCYRQRHPTAAPPGAASSPAARHHGPIDSYQQIGGQQA